MLFLEQILFHTILEIHITLLSCIYLFKSGYLIIKQITILNLLKNIIFTLLFKCCYLSCCLIYQQTNQAKLCKLEHLSEGKS